MPLWTGDELNTIFNSSLPSNLEIQGVNIDSRQVKAGDLFIAIHGVSQDGHQFTSKACENGAAVVLVDHEISGLSCPQIIVPDTLVALQQMAVFSRSRSLSTVIAITGSVGKTSTKEMLAFCLAGFGDVSFSEASFNNHWGVPLSLARLPRDAKFSIFEIGMNNPGEIAPLVSIVRPHISLITTIAPAHIGNMGNMLSIVREKASIYSGIVSDGIAIVPADTEYFDFLLSEVGELACKQVISFGTSEIADVRLIDYIPMEQGAKVKVSTAQEEIVFSFPLRGKHLAVNSLIIIGLATALNLDLDRLKKLLEKVPEIKNRGKVYNITINHKNITLIDDAYNANLTSMKAGIDVLAGYPIANKGRKIAVIGEMLELGEFANSHHEEIAQYLNSHSIDKIYAVGGQAMRHGFMALQTEKQGIFVETAMELFTSLLADLQTNDVILVKGSKGSKVSLIVDGLLKVANVDSKV